MSGVSKLFVDQFKAPRGKYKATQYPIILCHGLFGFSTIDLPIGNKISYFHGVKEALEKQGARVWARSVPPIASIQLRAQCLYDSLNKVNNSSRPRYVNIIAHSMGGLDSRYMVSKLLKPEDNLKIASLTTLSTPHRGSPIADRFKPITRLLPNNYGAFIELTTDYMLNQFNQEVLDDPQIKYFSYGARIKPSFWSPFWLPGRMIQKLEGDNDGMVSVASAKWGEYRGTLDNVDHGDIINMTRFKPRRLLNHNYSSSVMYLQIMDDLACMGF